ncbi:hypothetical protein HBI67_150210 [Parastagonospora nodorum]|nr:hypothetical protein HBI12_061210 [Parastagonospora nodorum]KAH6061870.1 hypothetical protein HBI67_150210 [Parastagonospora nodorum]KAH6072481.1 hypothetical protein HBI66_116960 [Parastagonospora nodorum]
MSEIEASRTQLQGVMDEFNEMTGTIRDYRKEQLELEKKIELLKLKRESEIVDNFSSQIFAKGKADLRELTDRIHAKFPMEIRDLVYQHVCVFHEPIILDATHPDCVPVPKDTGLHGLLSPNYLDENTFREMYKIYWSLNTFDVELRPSLDQQGNKLCEILGYDTEALWQARAPQQQRQRLQPYDTIRHLRIHIPAPKTLGKVTVRLSEQDFNVEQLFMASIAGQLAELYYCGQRGNTRIDFIVHTRISTFRRGVDQVFGIYDDERRFVNILEALKRTYTKLKRRGIRVSLRLRNVCSVAQTQTWDYTSHLVDVLNEERWRQDLRERADARDYRWGHYIPHLTLRHDPDGFRDMLWQRWQLRHALPWLDPTWKHKTL